jgi:putative membrane protein
MIITMSNKDIPADRERLRNFPLRIIQGAIVGGGAILPGVSGGVLCVAFGIYKPLMELLSHPVKSYKKHYRLILPFLIGWILGFCGLARLTELLFSVSSTAAVSIFAGLVAGTLPHLYTEAGDGNVRKTSYVAMTVSAFLMYALLSLLKNGAAAEITPNIGWYILCGIIWGLSLVVPGLSSSSILIFLGLYEPIASGIADLQPDVILPLIGGIVITVVLSAKLVDSLFQKHYQATYFTVLGIVFASTLLIVPNTFETPAEALICILMFFAGFTGAYALNSPRGNTEEK